MVRLGRYAERILKAKNFQDEADKFDKLFDKVSDIVNQKINKQKTQQDKSKAKYDKIESKVREFLNADPNMSLDSIQKKIAPLGEPIALDYAERAYRRVKNENITPQEARAKRQNVKKRDKETSEKRINLEDAKRKLIQKTLDRQYIPKQLLRAIEATRTENRMVNMSGASGWAKEVYDQAEKKIYGGLNAKEKEALDDIIKNRRVITIDEQRERDGKVPIKHEDGTDQNRARKELGSILEDFGSAKYKELYDRSEEYGKTMKELLTEMKENSIISQEAYDSMKDSFYSPRFFLEHFLDIYEQVKNEKTDRASNSTGL